MGSQQCHSRNQHGLRVQGAGSSLSTTHAVILHLPCPAPHVLCPPSLPTLHPRRLTPGMTHLSVHALWLPESLTENRKRRKQNIEPRLWSPAAAVSLPGHSSWWAAQPHGSHSSRAPMSPCVCCPFRHRGSNSTLLPGSSLGDCHPLSMPIVSLEPELPCRHLNCLN